MSDIKNILYFTDDKGENVKGAEKIKMVMVERNKQDNPFTRLILSVASSEKLEKGGSLTIFKKMYGIEEATRQTVKYTNNTVEYDGKFEFAKDIELRVSKPLKTKVYPIDNKSVALMDGMRIDTEGITKVALSLAKSEITVLANAFLNNDKSIKVDETGTSSYELMKAVKRYITNYFSMNSKNSFWPADTLKLFVGNRYQFNKGDIKIYMNPKDNLNWSNALTDQGMLSDKAFSFFVDGELKSINGVEIIVTPYIDEGTIFITPTEMIGMPDPAFIERKVWTQNPVGQGDTTITYGQSYIDAVCVFGELVTEIKIDVSASATVDPSTATFGTPVVTLESAADASDGSIAIDITPTNCSNPKAQLYYLGEASSSQGQGTLIASDVALTNDVLTNATWTGLDDGLYRIEVVDDNFTADSSIADLVVSANPTPSSFTKLLEDKQKEFNKQKQDFENEKKTLIQNFTDKLNKQNNS